MLSARRPIRRLSASRASVASLPQSYVAPSVIKFLLLSLFAIGCPCGSWGAVAFGSAHVVVVDEATGEVLLQKDAATAAPIASLTKLMTVMVVLDAQQDPSETIRIDEMDMDRLKHTQSGVPAGAVVSRGVLIELALIASDNHAAAALARNYPGGLDGFAAATDRKIQALALENTVLLEPTGLSPSNHSSALDIATVLRATSAYPLISEITSKRAHSVLIRGRPWAVRNTNGLVGKPGWEILASKTGFTNDAGRCLTMRIRAAGRTVVVVLIGAETASARSLDALNIHRWLAGKAPLLAAATQTPRRPRAKYKRAATARVVQTIGAGRGTFIGSTASGTSPSIDGLFDNDLTFTDGPGFMLQPPGPQEAVRST